VFERIKKRVVIIEHTEDGVRIGKVKGQRECIPAFWVTLYISAKQLLEFSYPDPRYYTNVSVNLSKVRSVDESLEFEPGETTVITGIKAIGLGACSKELCIFYSSYY
jgi:hypothetical protein